MKKKTNNHVHEHQTRKARYDFPPPKLNTSYQKNAFSYTDAVAWNKLSSEFISSKTILDFNNKIKIFLYKLLAIAHNLVNSLINMTLYLYWIFCLFFLVNTFVIVKGYCTVDKKLYCIVLLYN